jgi:hypothetical protein
MNAHKFNIKLIHVYLWLILLSQTAQTQEQCVAVIDEAASIIRVEHNLILITRCLSSLEYGELCQHLIIENAKKTPATEVEKERIKQFGRNTIALFDHPKGLKSYLCVTKSEDATLNDKLLVLTTPDKHHIFHSTRQRHPETPDSIDFYPYGMEGSRWLMFARITDPLDSPQCAFRFELTDDVYGVYRILQDNRLNRIGEDADAVFDDLVALKDAHAAGTLKDAPPALKTNFAKAVLARLLEQAAQPEQSNSEPSEVGRQAAE